MNTAYALRNVNLIHGDSSLNLQSNMTLLVNEQGRIENIAPDHELLIPTITQRSISQENM